MILLTWAILYMGTDTNVCQSRSYASAELAMTPVTQPGIVWGGAEGCPREPNPPCPTAICSKAQLRLSLLWPNTYIFLYNSRQRIVMTLLSFLDVTVRNANLLEVLGCLSIFLDKSIHIIFNGMWKHSHELSWKIEILKTFKCSQMGCRRDYEVPFLPL